MISSTLSLMQPSAASMGRQLMSTANSQVSPSQLIGRYSATNSNGDSFQSTTNNTAVSPRFAGWPREHKRLLREHIQDGCKLIARGQYEEAIEHFQGGETLNRLGVSVDSRCILSSEPPKTVQDAKRFIRQASRLNMAFDDNDSLSIKFARLGFIDRAKGGFFKPEPGTPEAKMMAYINLEQALMAAEENIHTYQNMDDGKNVTYHPAAGEESPDEHEIDIATTLEKFSLPLTSDFLKRYKGRAQHIKGDTAIDLVQDDDGTVRFVKVPVDKGQTGSSLFTPAANNVPIAT